MSGFNDILAAALEEQKSINNAAINMTIDISSLESITIKDGDSEATFDKQMLKEALIYIYSIIHIVERKPNEITIKVETPDSPIFSGSSDDDWYSDTVWRQTE